MYTRLLDFEREVDAQLARKKAEVNEALKRVDRETRTLRVYVYNTFKPATAPAVSATPDGEKTEVDPAAWTLHVQGRVARAGRARHGRRRSNPTGLRDARLDGAGSAEVRGFLRRLSVKIRGERNEESEHAWDGVPRPIRSRRFPTGSKSNASARRTRASRSRWRCTTTHPG